MLLGYVDLLINISILFGLGSVYILLPYKEGKYPYLLKISSGLLIGGIVLVVMNAQFNVTEGFLLDTRSVLLSTTAAFLGPIPGLIAATMASALRISQGGAGALTGVVVIYSTTIVGVIFGRLRVSKLSLTNWKSYVEIYLFGAVTHIVMLLCFFILPYDVAMFVLGLITVPVMVLYPLVTIPLAVILLVQRKNRENSLKIEHVSTHDYLTGFLNRYYLEKEFQKYKRFDNVGIIMGDVNGLKVINDSYGHLVGDQLLVMIAQILRISSPTEAELVRWGGDEFVIVIPDTNLIKMNEICLRVKEECKKVELRDVNPSISLGYSITNNLDLDTVFSEAEDLMYRNKLSEGASVRSSLISSLENTLIERKYETEHHSNKMAEYALKIGKKIGLMQTQLDELSLIAKLHDIGKIGISESILLKPARLDKEEFEEIKKHSEIGFRILDSIEELKHIAFPVLCHHEKWDGTGYPQGLKKDEIPVLSRIISVVDAFEAMTSGRIYQKQKSKAQALKELTDCSGTQFDPYLVDVFMEVV